MLTPSELFLTPAELQAPPCGPPSPSPSPPPQARVASCQTKWAVVRATESQDHKVYVGLRSFMTDLALLSTSTCDSLNGITMNFLQSRPSTFRESLPSIFDAKKQAWPNPEASLGDECQSIGRVKSWQAVGPALELKGNLTHSLQELLNNHRDSLE